MTAVDAGASARERVQELREQGMTIRAIAARFDRTTRWVQYMLNGPDASVPVEPLREAFARSGDTAATVAARAGWRDPAGYPDGGRVTRVLGLRGNGCGGRQQTAHRPTALALGRALGLDPHEVGL